jgi:hypothetical protein
MLSAETESSKNLAVLLDKVKTINNKHEEDANLTGSNYNVFSITKIERNEVSTHSAMIAELLNPRGSHHQGDVFLRRFVELIYNNCGLSAKHSDSEYAKAKVIVEYFIGKRDPSEPEKYGRIDIVLWIGEHLIVIENKIDAADQRRQLERYGQWMEKQTSSTKHLFYLTKHGSQPTVKSRGYLKEDDYVCLSYMQDISDWLDLCIKEAATAPILLGGIIQYKQLIQKITGSIGDKKIMDLTNMLKHNEHQMESALLVHQLLGTKKVQASLHNKFWSDLTESLNTKFSSLDLHIQHDDNLEKSIEKYANGKTRSTKGEYFGINIVGKDIAPFVLRIVVAVKAVIIGVGLEGERIKLKEEDFAYTPAIESLKEDTPWDLIDDEAKNGLLMHRFLGKKILSGGKFLNFKDFISTYHKHKLYKSDVIEELSEEIEQIILLVKNRIN